MLGIRQLRGNQKRIMARAAGIGIAVTMGLAVALAGGTSASAATVHPMSASQCGAAPGPGTWNTGCIDVYGSGLYVSGVQGSLTSTTAPYFPQDICNLGVHVFGILQGGAHYDVSATNHGCGRGELGLIWYPQANFQNQSLLCEQTGWSGQWSSPICIRIIG
jgi:hypothetical protein